MRYLGVMLFCLSLVAPVQAQIERQALATIPFTFELSGAVLGPGDYKVLYTDYVATIRNIDEPNQAALFVAVPWQAGPADQLAYKLVFNKYGSRYFLRQVWHGARYCPIVRSKQERELVTSRMVTRISMPETVVVAMRIVR